MAMSNELIQKLLLLLRPYMKSEQERSACLVRALGTDADVLYRLVWDTPVNVFIPNMVKELVAFGEITPGKPALSALLEVIREDVGVDVKVRLDELLQQIRQELKKQQPISEELNKQELSSGISRPPVHTLDIYILKLAFEAAKAVVHLRLPEVSGTGFMIASELLMTNNHIISSREQAEQSEYTFNYQLDIDGKECSTHTVRALPGGVFYTNAELDYTIVSLKDAPSFGKPLILKSKQVRRDDRVAIIQHPGGHLKKISMQNNFVAYADTKVMQYTRSTLPGSAGSPVLDDEFDVVAIHHSGGMLLEPGTDQRYLRSAGTSAIAVLNDLKSNAPEIYTRLKG
jgi:hypothetical protein